MKGEEIERLKEDRKKGRREEKKGEKEEKKERKKENLEFLRVNVNLTIQHGLRVNRGREVPETTRAGHLGPC